MNPTPQPADELTEKIHRLAENLIDDWPSADAEMDSWIWNQPREVGDQRLRNIAEIAPLIAARLIRKHGPTPTPGALWRVLDTITGGTGAGETTTMQVLAAYLNDDRELANGLIGAAIDTGGDKALRDLAVEGLRLLVTAIVDDRSRQ